MFKILESNPQKVVQQFVLLWLANANYDFKNLTEMEQKIVVTQKNLTEIKNEFQKFFCTPGFNQHSQKAHSVLISYFNSIGWDFYKLRYLENRIVGNQFYFFSIRYYLFEKRKEYECCLPG